MELVEEFYSANFCVGAVNMDFVARVIARPSKTTPNSTCDLNRVGGIVANQNNFIILGCTGVSLSTKDRTSNSATTNDNAVVIGCITKSTMDITSNSATTNDNAVVFGCTGGSISTKDLTLNSATTNANFIISGCTVT